MIGNPTITPTPLRPPARRRATGLPILLALLALALMAGACGDDDEVVAGSGGTGPNNGSTDGSGSTEGGGSSDADGGDGRVITESRPDLISAKPSPIDEVGSIDDRTLAVHYSNGSEPCALANVTVAETGTTITVDLDTGLHPNVAAMSCIAQLLDYEIRVALEEPIGDREIVFDQS